MTCDKCGNQATYNLEKGLYVCPTCEDREAKAKAAEAAALTADKEDTSQQGSLRFLKTRTSHELRRINSEQNLADHADWHADQGAAYHFISHGDVDSFTFLNWILRQQPLEYLAASTWCMSLTDIADFEKYTGRGLIKRLDFYVGEIFQRSYAKEHAELTRVCRACGGRVAIFRNHAKIYTGRGRLFDFAIESSANINTNPRTENTTVTIDTNLMLFYKNFFDEIISFKRDFDDWKPYEFLTKRTDLSTELSTIEDKREK